MWGEVFGSLLSLFSVGDDSTDTVFFNRLHDCSKAFVLNTLHAIQLSLIRLFGAPVASIGIVFELIATALYLILIMMQAVFGVTLNLAHLVINNLLTDTLLHGIVINAAMIATCLVPALWNKLSQREIIESAKGLYSGFFSLWTIFKTFIMKCPSLLIGAAWLHIDTTKTQKNEQFLQYVDNKADTEWPIGLKCNVISALRESINSLSTHLYDMFSYCYYVLSSPLFVMMYLLQGSFSLVCAAEKAIMTVPICTVSFFTGEAKSPSHTSIYDIMCNE